MKVFGWICVAIGGIALMGAIVGGSSAFGPLFWLGLGVALLYFSNQKKDDINDNISE